MTEYAPVLIPTLCRYTHFRRCVESLAACTHADKTELYVALDYPLNETHWDGYKKMESYVQEISGFKKVIIIKRDHNYGVRKNCEDARRRIYENYDRYIFSEDDNEFSPNFLDYVNKGLEKFKDDARIYAICGYSYPVKIPQSYTNSHYFALAYSAWGVGVWKNRRDKFHLYCTIEAVEKFLKSTNGLLLLIKNRYSLLGMLLGVIKNGIPLGDVVLGSYLMRTGMRCVFPTITMVRNHGHDGSGVNCGAKRGKDPYASRIIDTQRSFEFSDAPSMKANKIITKLVDRYCRCGFRATVCTTVKYLLYRLTGHVYQRKRLCG